ncbi:agmatine deiminase family protein [Candidatus Woesearchaeota archaeon]|nr:agmatine deiminase family protein [Candidatus Woesearchaeota archaeon]
MKTQKLQLPTPKSLGYHMPAEWEEQEAIWLAWPKNEETWMDFLPKVQEIFIEFVYHLHFDQKINVLVDDKASETIVREKFKNKKIDLSKVNFYQIKTIDAWMRDIGPTFVVNRIENSQENKKDIATEKRIAMVNWIFNAWGNKYDDLKADNIIPKKMNEFLNMKRFKPKIVLEGGSIEVNGKGTCLTSKQCLLNKNRNPQLSQKEIEQYLKDYLGASNIIWLNEGIVGDDTDGHIDDLARFVDATTVVCVYEDDKSDENYNFLSENYTLLKQAKDQDGNALKIIKLPMPGKVFDEETGKRLPASYANFYIGNKTVVVPIFGHENDEKALKILQECFVGRKVVGINCAALVLGFGTLHCISQQMPMV